MRKKETKNQVTQFQKFLHTYNSYYKSFAQQYPNKTFDKTEFQIPDPQLNMLSDLASHSLHTLEETGHHQEEKINLKMACGELKSLFSPMPPMSIIQFNSQTPCFIPKQSFISIENPKNSASLLMGESNGSIFKNLVYENHPCQIKTVYSVPIFPGQIHKLKYKEENAKQGITDQSICLDIKSNQNQIIQLKNHSCHEFIFYINERLENAFLIYDILMQKTKSM